MDTMWGIHNDQLSIDPVADRAIRVGWEEVGDLSSVPPTRDAFKAVISERMPDVDPKTIAGSAGTLYRFVHEIQIGDIVVCPNRGRRTLNIGRVSGPYEFIVDAPVHNHRRPVDWLITDASRDELSAPAQNEISSATTLFRITTGREEFEHLLAEPGGRESDYSWVAFYTELGQRLLDYAGNRDVLLEKFWTVADQSGYPHLFKYLKADKLRDGSSGPLRDTDPFTVLASFNRGIKNDARAEIAKAFAEEFQVSAAPPTQFSGIPTANNLKSWFVRHEIDRGPNDVENLWRLAAAAFAYSQHADESSREILVTEFDAAASGNTRLLTMGLYWMFPRVFAAYDSVNASYIEKEFPDLASRLTLGAKISGDQFLSNTETLHGWLASSNTPFSQLCELSHAAWLDVTTPAVDEGPQSAPPVTPSVPEIDLITVPGDPYDVAAIRDDGCFLSESELTPMLERLRSKKNLILQGPPGTGKTWLARRLAWALCNERSSNRVEILQFHPSLVYEDFVRGWRPTATQTGGGLSLEDGPFLQLCSRAAQDHDHDYVLVIEEINRGNPAQVLGELLTLIEADKRTTDSAMRLAYPRENEKFFVPANLYLIGTMNVADRSLAIVDMALRRRFAFIELHPSLGTDWAEYVSGLGYDRQLLEYYGHLVDALNEQIAKDGALGRQFCVGHSYFTPTVRLESTGLDTAGWWERVVETDVRPLLEEYWFDRPEIAGGACERLLGA